MDDLERAGVAYAVSGEASSFEVRDGTFAVCKACLVRNSVVADITFVSYCRFSRVRIMLRTLRSVKAQNTWYLHRLSVQCLCKAMICLTYCVRSFTLVFNSRNTELFIAAQVVLPVDVQETA